MVLKAPAPEIRAARLPVYAAFDAALQPDVLAPEAQAVSDHQEFPAALGRVGHPRAFGGRERHRLFAQTMRAPLQRLDRRAAVQIGGQDDVDEIRRFGAQHLVIIGIMAVIAVMLRRSAAGKVDLRRSAAGELMRLHVANRDDFYVRLLRGQLLVHGQMIRTHAADPAQRDLYHSFQKTVLCIIVPYTGCLRMESIGFHPHRL